MKRKLNEKKTKKVKKEKKSEKKQKKRKNRLEFRFALFRFEAKITKVKRSEKFEAKRSKKREVKFYSEIVKHKWNGSKFALFRLQYKRKKILSEMGSPCFKTESLKKYNIANFVLIFNKIHVVWSKILCGITFF